MLRRFIVMILLLPLMGCSAIELHQQTTKATPDADVVLVASMQAEQAQLQATLQALYSAGTAAAETVAALEATATGASATSASEVTIEGELTAAETQEAGAVFVQEDMTVRSAIARIYGRVPVDSDSLNSVTALAFDREGHLLVSTRAGEIYRLIDGDGDGEAESTEMIFNDADDEIGQVSGMIALGETLMLINDGRLNQLLDSDADGIYDSVTLLSTELPANQNPLQANNSIAQAPDGRLFTADINSGEILQIVLRE